MPKRIVDGEALWQSSKLRNVKLEYRAEYANLIPLAEANGVFEADPQSIWSRVYACNRPDIQIKDVIRILDEFEKHGLLRRWEERNKIWGFWIGIEKPGRLPSAAHVERGDYHLTTPLPPGELRVTTGDHPPSIGLVGVMDGVKVREGHVFRKAQTTEGRLEELCQDSGMTPEEKKTYRAQAKAAARKYSEPKLLSMFESWLSVNASIYTGKRPVSAFLRALESGQQPLLESKADPKILDNLVLEIVLESDNIVSFSPNQMLLLGRMVSEYGEQLVLEVFRDFYSRIDDDYGRKFAAKDFVEKGPQLLAATYVRNKRKQSEDQAMELGKAQMQAAVVLPEPEDENTGSELLA